MIDWDKPLEAVHTDGRVVSIDRRDTSKRTTDTWWVSVEDKTFIFGSFGQSYGNGWTIRNAAEQPAWRTSAEQLDRMNALVERLAQYGVASIELRNDARAILAARGPVDPDIAIAAQICDRSPYDLTGLNDARAGTTNRQIREAVLAGIKYGRAQG